MKVINIYGSDNRLGLHSEESKKRKIKCAKNDHVAVQLLLYMEDEMIVCINDDTCFYEKEASDIIREKVDIPGIDKKV